VGTAAHLNQVLELLRKLMEYRSDQVRHWLEKVGRAAAVFSARDYFGPAKAAPIRAQVDALVSEGRLLPFGYYGWGTWVGQWHRQ